MKTIHRDAARVFTSLTLFTSLSLLTSALVVSAQKPIFRARIDLLQLDVTVLDKKGDPVRGLTAADFILLEDNKPQTIEGFTAVDLPDRVVAGPVWSNKVTPDVTTNDIDNQRIFVLVIDDALGMGVQPGTRLPDPWAIREMKESAELFINQLGPKDLVALVFTQNVRQSQNLTLDHQKLVKAIQAYPPLGGGQLRGSCLGAQYSVGLVEGVVQNLASVPDRRKAIVYFGGDLPWSTLPDPCGIYWLWRKVFAVAQSAHVTISPVDTMGLRASASGSQQAAVDKYLTVAENTGGRAIINSNDFEPGIRRIFRANSSYYLLAYQPTNAAEDGTFRRISLKVRDRPDVEVTTRRNYWAPKSVTGEPPPPPPPPDIEALSGILPLSKLNLRVTAAPFPIVGTERSVVTLALGVRQAALADRTSEQVEVLIKAFTADGDARGTETQTIPITVPAARADSDHSRYEVLARIELPKPGKYELRLSAHSGVADTRGSVFVDVEVPDFRKEKLSLSGVILSNAFPTTPVAPARALRDLIPVVPTTERIFATGDPITAFMRLYQGGNAALTAATIRVQIQDAAGKSVFDKTDAIAADRFNEERAADYQLRLPLSTLTVGEYLLTLEAMGGKGAAKREVRFQIR